MPANRRTVTKYKPAVRATFDDYQWPVNISLVVLGGFLLGAILAYQDFNDARWFARPWVSISLVLLLIVSTMLTLSYAGNRWLRRTMQFSIVICAIVHLVFLVFSLENTIFSRSWTEQVARRDLMQQQQVRVPQPNPLRVNTPEDQLDLERPVDTPDPEPVPRDIERPEPEQPRTPEPPQPRPVEEPQPRQPEVVKQRSEQSPMAPRMAQQQSQLSRQQDQQPSASSAAVQVPSRPSTATPSQTRVEATTQQTQRAVTATNNNRTVQPVEAASQTSQQANNVRRSDNQQQAVTESTSRTVAPRVPEDVARQPNTQAVPVPAEQAVARNTPAPAPTPRNTLARQQMTRSPAAQPQPDPVVQPPQQNRPQPTPQQPTPRQVTMARTPQPVQNLQPRVTQQQAVTPSQDIAVPTATPQPQQPAAVEAVARQLPARQVTPSQQTTVTTEMASQPTPNPQQTTERQQVSQQASNSQSNNQLARQESVSNAVTSQVTPSQAEPVGVAAAAPSQLQASAVDLSRQSPEATSSRRTVQTVSPADQAMTSISNPTTEANRARTSNQAANPQATAARQSNQMVQRQTNSTAIAADRQIESIQAPANVSQPQSGSVNVSSAQVNRSQTSDATARAQVAAADRPSTSSASQQATVAAARASEQSRPAISRDGENRVERSQLAAESAQSPSAVQRPNVAGSVSATPSTTPSRPAPQSLARSTTGASGAGRTANLDNSVAALSNAEANPTAAASRERATSTSQQASTTTPTDSVSLQRSRAEAQQAQATAVPNTDNMADQVAAATVSQQTVDAAASLQRSTAEADPAATAASAGEVQVDTGPMQVVSEQQVGRASGGGQPAVNLQATAEPMSRAPAGVQSPALATTNAAALAAAPESDPGSQASASAVAEGRVSVQRQVASTSQAETGAPVNASQEGDAQAVAGDAIARAELQRASDQQAGKAGSPDDVLREQSLGSTPGSSLAQRQALGVNAARVSTEVAAPAPSQGSAEAAPVATALQAAAGQPARAEAGNPATAAAAAPAVGQIATSTGAPSATNNAAAVPRAEAVDAARGGPQTGGGSALPRQSVDGTPLATNNRSTIVEVAGAEASSGNQQGVPLDTEGKAGRLASGTAGKPLERPVGAPNEALAAAGSGGPAAPLLGRAEQQADGAAGPTSNSANAPGGTLGRQDLGAEASGAVAATVDLPMAQAAAGGTTQPTAPGEGFLVGPVPREDTSGLPVPANAPEGVGGLGDEVSLEVGIADRRAVEDSIVVQLKAARFVKQGVDGLPSMNSQAEIATDSFKGRTSRDGGGRGSAPPQTEQAIELGLAFLARYQKEDGSWSLDQFDRIDGRTVMQSDTAAVGLCLMAFQGAGYTHKQFKYKDAMRAAVDFVVSKQDPSGDYYFTQGNNENQVARLYTHAIVTLAMCEAYGMTQDEDLKASVQKGLDFIVETQHAERGGWRYSPGRESDTSVTGWMMTALESGRRAGLDVPVDSFQKAVHWLDLAGDPDQPHLFRYNPLAPDTVQQGSGRAVTKTMTSVGLLMRLYSGWKTTDPRSIAGAEYLQRNLPSISRGRKGSLRDTYYWYYATQFMFHMGGDYWKAWNDRLYPLLLNTQTTRGDLAGSWDPRVPQPDRWGAHAGRVYVTTMNLLSLEVHYRYLPLYDDSPYKSEVAASEED